MSRKNKPSSTETSTAPAPKALSKTFDVTTLEAVFKDKTDLKLAKEILLESKKNIDKALKNVSRRNKGAELNAAQKILNTCVPLWDHLQALQKNRAESDEKKRVAKQLTGLLQDTDQKGLSYRPLHFDFSSFSNYLDDLQNPRQKIERDEAAERKSTEITEVKERDTIKREMEIEKANVRTTEGIKPAEQTARITAVETNSQTSTPVIDEIGIETDNPLMTDAATKTDEDLLVVAKLAEQTNAREAIAAEETQTRIAFLVVQFAAATQAAEIARLKIQTDATTAIGIMQTKVDTLTADNKKLNEELAKTTERLEETTATQAKTFANADTQTLNTANVATQASGTTNAATETTTASAATGTATDAATGNDASKAAPTPAAEKPSAATTPPIATVATYDDKMDVFNKLLPTAPDKEHSKTTALTAAIAETFKKLTGWKENFTVAFQDITHKVMDTKNCITEFTAKFTSNSSKKTESATISLTRTAEDDGKTTWKCGSNQSSLVSKEMAFKLIAEQSLQLRIKEKEICKDKIKALEAKETLSTDEQKELGDLKAKFKNFNPDAISIAVKENGSVTDQTVAGQTFKATAEQKAAIEAYLKAGFTTVQFVDADKKHIDFTQADYKKSLSADSVAEAAPPSPSPSP